MHFWRLVYVPDVNEIKCMTLQLYHNFILAGHPGQANTLALIVQNYYWLRMSEFVCHYMEGCKMCQRTKPHYQKLHGPLQPLKIPNGPWQHISTDYISPLLMLQGFSAVQVVCDKSTKKAHFLRAHSTNDVTAMCNTFWERVWCLHSTLKKVVLDRGPQFVARYVRWMWERLGIKQALSTAHHLQTNGQMEHANQELEVYLCTFVHYYQDDWVEWLPFAKFVYKNQVSALIGMSLFYTEYAYNPMFLINSVNSQSMLRADA